MRPGANLQPSGSSWEETLMSCGRHRPYFICTWGRRCARKLAWKSCEKLTHRRVKWLRLLAKLFHLEEKYRIKQREHSFLDPCQSGDETWLILGISDDLKDALGVAVRSLLHHFDAGSAIWFMLCLRNPLEASSMRFILNVRLWDSSNSTDTDYL